MRSVPHETQDSWRRSASAWLSREPRLMSDRARVTARIYEEADIQLSDAELCRFLSGASLEAIAAVRGQTTKCRLREIVGIFFRKNDSLVIGTVVGLALVGLASYLIHQENQAREQLRTELARIELAKRDELRQQARLRLDGLRALTSLGKAVGNVRVQATREGDRMRLTVWNDTAHPLGRVALEFSDRERWAEIQGERYNGIPVAEMGQKMRPSWLRATGYHERTARLRTETHQHVEFSGPIRARDYLQRVVDIPTEIQRARTIDVVVSDAWGVDGVQWSSPVQEILAEAASR